jgi:2-keto-4-pentenoate hydratase
MPLFGSLFLGFQDVRPRHGRDAPHRKERRVSLLVANLQDTIKLNTINSLFYPFNAGKAPRFAHAGYARRGYAKATSRQDPPLHVNSSFAKRIESMEEIAARRAAEWLLAEHEANARFKRLGPPDGPASISDAYDIQERYVALLRSKHGEAVGYKVGLTSAPMQAFCRIDHPIAGVVLASRVHRSEAAVRRSDFGRLGLEFEIAVRIKSDVPVTGRPCTAETIAPHVDGICAAVELVDDRSADYTSLDVLSLVADNSWNGGIILSEFAGKWPDLESVLGRATKDDVAIGEGHGRDILGHPFNSAAWLATQLHWRGASLKAGEVVMTGSVMKTVFPEEAAGYRFDLEQIGFVEVQVR